MRSRACAGIAAAPLDSLGMDSEPADSGSTPRIVAAAAAGVVALVLVAAAIMFLFSATIEEVFKQVADDYCERAASGEPDRNDPDCHSTFGDGRNLVEEWDQEHP